MTKRSAALVSYSSSDEEIQPSPPSKKRKLPPVPISLVVPISVDNPALHQGRIRTTPHVDGRFPAHIYVSLTVSRTSRLYQVVQGILKDATTAIPSLNHISSTDSPENAELHISLSRPVFLGAHQREDFKRAVKSVAAAHKTFLASFALVSELTNDEETRTFLTLEVGAGHHELAGLANSLAPAIQAIRQQPYYPNPRFHASIAWALLHPNRKHNAHSTYYASTNAPHNAGSGSSTESSTSFGFPTILRFPPELIETLNKTHRSSLSAPKVGTFEVEKISMKIGKVTTSWKLSNS